VIQLATIGTSKIAHQFAAAVQQVGGIQLAGVFSRGPERAAAMAKELGAPRAWSDLDTMLSSPEVDAVYVASPNAVHYAQCRAAIQAGKHVLVEKPAVVTAAEFETLLALAQNRGLVLLEGMRSAYDPGMELVRQLLPLVGPVRRVSFEYCQRSARYDQVQAGRPVNIFDPALAGGALNDLGVYCVSALVDLFGEPDRVVGAHVMVTSGVDGAGSALASYPDFVADISYSKITASERPSQIEAELGTLTIDHIAEPFRVRLHLFGSPVEEHVAEKSAGNLNYEIERFVQLVTGEADPATDQQRTLMTLRTMEGIRASA
jgi:predicted dehydrogenase